MRVLVAMSGGVDSAVAAGLLAEAGHAVVGATLQLYDHGAATGRKGACCAGQDIHDARDAAQALGIPHYVLDRQDRFRAAVIGDFADAYARGETPVPCVRCNQTVKFEDLLELARDLGCQALATGHYARRVDGPRGPELHRAADPARDQSYFLHATTAAQLAFARFPLGDLPDKATVRAHAARLGLALSAKPDSQDLCFVPAGRYDAVATALRPDAGLPGQIVHRDGRVLGRHAGIAGYTVGQGRGLGTASFDGPERLAVHAIDAGRRRVVVGPRAGLPRAIVAAGAVNWLAPPPAGPFRAEVRLRARGAPQAATLRWDPDGEGGRGLLSAVLDRPDVASPGQALVLYDGTRLLAGGTLRAPACAVDSVPPPAYVGAPAGTAA